MRQLIRISCLVFFCILFVSCGSKKEDASMHTYAIYYLNSQMTELVYKDYQTPRNQENKEALARELLKEMRKSEDANDKSALGEDVEVMDIQCKESQLSVYFSATYNERNGTEEILSRAAIVQTLCGIEGIDYVEFYVEDQPLMISGNAVGLMNSESFLTDLERQGEGQTRMRTLYFSDTTGDYLVAAQTPVNYVSAAPLARLLLEYLIEGEETIIRTNKRSEAIPTVPASTVLNSLTIRDNVCYLDVSKGINELLEGIRSEVVVYSIVNTLCELPNVNRVQITVDGEPQKKYGEMEGFDLMLERKLDIVKGE